MSEVTGSVDTHEAAFRTEHNPIDRESYYEEKVREIESGALVWAVRTFESDRGRVYDLFLANVHRGFVDEEDGRYDGYYLQGEMSEPSLVIGDSLSVVEAIHQVEALVKTEN